MIQRSQRVRRPGGSRCGRPRDAAAPGGANEARYDRQVVDRMLLATKDQPAKNWDEACGQYLLFRTAFAKDPRFKGLLPRSANCFSFAMRSRTMARRFDTTAPLTSIPRNSTAR